MTAPDPFRGGAAGDGFVVGEWTVLPSRNLLARGGDELRVEPRVMDVLVYLSERAGEMVSKDELIARVWNGRYVTDDVLTVAVYALRKAFADEARRPRYIETVSRRGYRLIAPVQAVAAPRREAPPPTARVAAAPPTRRPPVWAIALALALVVALVTGMTWLAGGLRHRRHVPPAEAHEEYVKGRYFLDQRSIRGWQQALEHFQRAVQIDPEDPAAEAGLADTYSAMSDFGVASPAEMRPRAMEAAGRALALDRRAAEAHAALGRAQFLFDWDFDAAERSLRRAAVLDPDYMPAQQSLAWLESARGRHAEAIAAAQRALQLDPVNTARYTELAWVLALAGRYADAQHEVERALLLNARSFQTHLMKGWVAEMSGDPDAAFAAYRDGLRVAGAADAVVTRSEAAFRAGGLPGYYRMWLDHDGAGGPMSETWRAQMYVRTGDVDRAIAALEHAYQKREGALAWVNVEPSFQPLRADPRFRRIADRVGRRP